jgi:hypothetical protein
LTRRQSRCCGVKAVPHASYRHTVIRLLPTGLTALGRIAKQPCVGN